MASEAQETPKLVTVDKNVEPDVEREQVEKFLAQRGVPTDRADRGKGKFGQGQMRSVESNLPPHPAAMKHQASVEESEPEDETETAEEADEPKESAPAPAKAAAPPSDEELAAKLAELLGSTVPAESHPDPAKEFVQRRKEARAGREIEQITQERDRLAGTVDVLLEELARARGEAPPAAAGNEEPPEEEPDLFVNPEAYVNKRLEPLRTEIEQLRAELTERRRNETIDSVRRAEQSFAAEHPDYHDVITRHREKAYNEFLRRGATEEKAVELLQRFDQGQIQLAQELGVAPWVMFYESARDALGLSGEPATAPTAPAAKKPTKAARPNGSIAAAKAAVASPSAATLSVGGGKLTSGAILASDMTPEDVRQMLNEPGGLRKFTALMRERENRAE
jgi:hypothetical protein